MSPLKKKGAGMSALVPYTARITIRNEMKWTSVLYKNLTIVISSGTGESTKAVQFNFDPFSPAFHGGDNIMITVSTLLDSFPEKIRPPVQTVAQHVEQLMQHPAAEYISSSFTYTVSVDIIYAGSDGNLHSYSVADLGWETDGLQGQFSLASNENNVSNKSWKLPGMNTVVVCPCEASPHKNEVWSIIQHLNDTAKWSREKIADWLDELHDSGQINIEFQPWNEGEENEDTREG